MNVFARLCFTAASCVTFAIVLTSCSQNTTGGSGTFDGAPLVQSTQIVQPPAKQIAYSDASLKGWRSIGTQDAFIPVSAGAHAPAELSLTGNGRAIATAALSPVISVTPGQTYTVSAWINAPKATSSYPILWISNEAGDKIYRASKITNTQAGRYGFDVKIPDDVSKITLAFYTNGSVLAKGATISFSQPLLAFKSSP